MRTIVDLPEEQLTALARLCEEQKISRAEAVRRAVDRLIRDQSGQKKDIGFGMWKHKRADTKKLIEKLRNEWSER